MCVFLISYSVLIVPSTAHQAWGKKRKACHISAPVLYKETLGGWVSGWVGGCGCVCVRARTCMNEWQVDISWAEFNWREVSKQMH